MNEIINKLSSYNILNFLIPGGVYLLLCDNYLDFNIETSSVSFLLVAYIAGMIISRVGSLIIEPIFRSIKLISYAKYSDYVKASMKDQKIETLLMETNMLRTMISLVLLFLFSVLIQRIKIQFDLHHNLILFIGLIFVLLILFLSYRKQISYIKKRIDISIKQD
jgi:predicted neutral ceramidase superfamily lipid hydrolase